MRNIDTDSLLDDFEIEARAHIEKIESAFLEIDALRSAPEQMAGVFRAAHSLKGTAGFFSLDKIVAVAHELENVFAKIRDGKLDLTDALADAVFLGVDCLKDLTDNLHNPGAVDTEKLLKQLKGYSDTQAPEKSNEEAGIFSGLMSPARKQLLKSAAKRGQNAYYLRFGFSPGLGRYFDDPTGLVGDILSIGAIVEALVGDEAVLSPEPSGFAAALGDRLKEHAGAVLELLVVSVLEPDLFLIAVELDSRFVHWIPKEAFSEEEKDKKQGAEASAQAQWPPTQLPAHKNGFSIRLDVSVVNGLMDLANEMILTRNRLLSSMSSHLRLLPGLLPVLNDMNRLTSEMQEKIMRTRMQPVSTLFGKFPRMIRDMAKLLRKDIQMEIFGDETALDKYLLDALSDPVTQLVKNSADHGIETAARRAALGKPLKGKITLRAYTRDGAAFIEVADDGAGMDVKALGEKGLERGIVSEEQLAVMSPGDVFSLIFEPGFSTAKQVTSVSGRGVGMDIVKTNIEKLGGSIEIESELNRGTVIRLKTPLTLSVVRTLIVSVHSVLYAVPEINVERIARVSGLTPSKRVEWVNGAPVLNLDGWILPAVTMERADGRANGLEPQPDALLDRSFCQDVLKFLVLRTGGKYFALLIDDAIGTEETLVKPLPLYLQRCRCYANVTVLGNGSAAMLLDAEGILRFMGIEGVPKPNLSPGMSGTQKEVRQIIIFKCSGAEYFALDAGSILRIERVIPEHIQEIGDGHFVNIAGKTVRVLMPEDYAPVQKRGYAGSKLLYVLMLCAGAAPMGFLASRVIDKVEDAFDLDNGHLNGGFIFGTGVYREKILVFLDSARILEGVETGGKIGGGSPDAS